MGELGSGAAAKMILQVVVCINMLGPTRLSYSAEKCGLDFRALQEVLRVSSGQSFVAEHWLDRFKRPEDPLPIRRRRAEVFIESLVPALRLAKELDIALPGTTLARELFQRVMGVEESGEKLT